MRAACAIALCAALAMPACGANATEEYMPGQPLDAVKMSAPTFANQSYPCYKVVDRTSGACWWLLNICGEWVVLPICQSRAYEQQQEVN